MSYARFAAMIATSTVFGGALWLVRSQETVDDLAYMKAMIPHHSIAIMTSERAHIRDPRVRLIARLERRPVPGDARDIPSYRDRGAPPPPGETDADAGIDTTAPVR